MFGHRAVINRCRDKDFCKVCARDHAGRVGANNAVNLDGTFQDKALDAVAAEIFQRCGQQFVEPLGAVSLEF